MNSNSMTTVRVEGLEFFGTAPDVGFAMVQFEGYNDGPSARGDETAHPAQHGEFDSTVLRGSRLITLSGWCRAESWPALGHLRNRLMSVLADGQTGLLTVSEFGESLWCDVRLYGLPTFRRRGSSMYADWSIKFRAADPRKYGEVRTFSAGQSVIHYGNFPALPELTVTGPHPAGYTVTAGDSQFTVTTALASGSTDVIDMSTGWVRRNGVLLVGGVSVADTWTVPPGLPGVVHSLTGGSGSLTVRVTDTFI